MWQFLLYSSIFTHTIFVIVQLKFNKNVKCQEVCEKKYTKSDKEAAEKLKFLKKGIELNYFHHWYVHVTMNNLFTSLLCKYEQSVNVDGT